MTKQKALGYVKNYFKNQNLLTYFFLYTISRMMSITSR